MQLHGFRKSGGGTERHWLKESVRLLDCNFFLVVKEYLEKSKVKRSRTFARKKVPFLQI